LIDNLNTVFLLSYVLQRVYQTTTTIV